jgi:hypothetical protein
VIVDLLARLSHHEAGHVVADRVCGVAVKRVMVDKVQGGRTDISGFGAVDLEGLSPTECRQKLEPAMIGLLAGPYAEERLVGNFDPEMAARDLHSVASMGFDCVASLAEWPAYEAELSGRARHIVDKQWASIEDLANHLAHERRLSADELAAWFGAHPLRSGTT